MPRDVLALDIGGANLKAAHSSGAAWLKPFALWKYPTGLASALAGLLRAAPAFDLLAVTMTGELCDCFRTKREGVHAILDAVESAAGQVPVRVWQTDGTLVEVTEARENPLKTAAANWLALAHLAGRYLPKTSGLLVDVGSTTTDVIPIFQGQPCPAGRTDPERLRSRELVYTGVRRTPLCALLGGEGAAELFATTFDVYLILGQLPEDETDRDTADGRPATRLLARERLARMACADRETLSERELHQLAEKLHQCQLVLLSHAMKEVARRLPAPPEALVLAGSGEFLVRAVIQAEPSFASLPIISLRERLGPEISQAACAYALMILARETVDEPC